MQQLNAGIEMRLVKDSISSMENMFKTKSRKGYQALTHADLRTTAKEKRNWTVSIVRQSPRSKDGGQR